MKPGWKCLLVGVVVAATLLWSVPGAEARWCGYGGYGCGYGYGYGYGYGWGCYTPSYSSCYSCYSPSYTTIGCYGSCYDNCGWYMGWRPGPVRRLLLGRYRWYWGGCGYSCYSSCCSCGCGCVGTCDCGCDGTAVTAPATGTPAPTPAKKPVGEPAMPVEPGTPAPPAPADQPVPPKTGGISSQESGILTVWVPYDAKVTINGLATKSTGSRRQFVSFGLKPGLSYRYVVKAQIIRGGQPQEDTRTITLTAGQVTAVAFGFNVPVEQVASAH